MSPLFQVLFKTLVKCKSRFISVELFICWRPNLNQNLLLVMISNEHTVRFALNNTDS